MTLDAIFKKPIDRQIEGVIKADDDTSLSLEFEEYVLTSEVEGRLEDFLDAYNNYEGANGVWISGFFGSGKSHLLKILAMLLENRAIEGASALDLFLSKCGDNEILRANIAKAASIPSSSILFNVDQKADIISKTQADALLAVFVKVFDEMSGYYGKQGYIAQFERELDSRGQYDPFKKAFEALTKKTWEQGREQALLESENIAKAYSQATNSGESEGAGILDKYRSQYSVSIEDFAEQVNRFIEKQPHNFRLNFFVDEVGQYIADNVRLMTNLQTIAESLATKCKGRAWIIVTAQEDMDSVVGEMNDQQGNDFTKIQARFSNRMKLTSTDVAEVIQKRLLMKNDLGIQSLTDIHKAQSNNFKTLFDFADGSKTYRNYQDREHFIHSYPFIPYQFTLFQSAIQSLSQHSAFEGKHSSVGERSMLGVFQQVAVHISGYEVGQLATFDLMFEGIRTVLKSNIQRAILQAEEHLGNPFAVRLLKTLFLVKYVKEFKPTIHNLSILALENFNQDLPALHKKLEETLNLLEQQTYIQRNGQQFEFLTDEEKDVEQDIKNTEIETTEVANELEKIIFGRIIKNTKIRSEESRQDYSYSKKLDDRLHGREHELAIHVITPFHENAGNETVLCAQSMGRIELLVLMPPDDRIRPDIVLYKQTEKYFKQNISTAERDSVKSILNDKSSRNQERYAELIRHIQDLLGKAKLVVAGNDVDIGGEDAQTRIIRGFDELITRTYPHLRMLQGLAYAESDVAKYLDQSAEGLFGNDATSLTETEQEMLSFINSNNRGGVRTTIKNLLAQFESKPYGWPYAAILCTLAKLCARGKIEARSDGTVLEEADLERGLRNTHGHANVVLDPQVEYTALQVRRLREFHADFFDSPPQANEAKALARETGAKLQEMINQLTPLASQSSIYAFLIQLNPVNDTLRELHGKPYTWYLTELSKEEDALLDLKENLLDPIRSFMNGSQKIIFDEARMFMQEQDANFSYIKGDELAQITQALADLGCFKDNRMQQVKGLVSTLKNKMSTHIKAEITRANTKIGELEKRLCAMSEFVALTPEQQEQIKAPFINISQTIEQQKLIAVIRDTLRRFEETDYQNQLSRLSAWAEPQPAPVHTPEPKPGQNGTPGFADGPTTVSAPPLKEIVPLSSLTIAYQKAWLADEADIDNYLEAKRKALLEEIRKGKRVQI